MNDHEERRADRWLADLTEARKEIEQLKQDLARAYAFINGRGHVPGNGCAANFGGECDCGFAKATEADR